ncbi:hypothetical protein [Humisphaera borealis]|uniref:Uncharacterized protein n=1 Tax=Humisphaera borealis TaxID=2807512 RepID=A0A7M2WPS8_9BACT|nr:hypothetical protein [Humisphaera borealis]QOV87466.1 hypothetical protein IPV69_14330 [Humisphaera borealis]
MKTKAAPQSSREKLPPPLDVLVIGEHPSAYLAATLLHAGEKGKAPRVIHATLPGEQEPDRLVLINPAVFGLHPLLEPIRRRLESTAIYGLQFISDDPAVRSEHRSKTILGYVASSKAVRAEFARVAEQAGVECCTPKKLEILRLDETGVDVAVGKQTLRPRALILSTTPDPLQQKLLRMHENWGPEVVHRYSYIRLAGKKWGEVGNRPVAPMSLNLRDTLCWGWLLPGPKCWQIAVSQPIEAASQVPAALLLAHWAKVLHAAGSLGAADVPLDHIESIDLPLTGALMQEGVANRTLLVGPAGGFYTASAEDIYPNCWSAVHAVEAMKKALKEPHLQDALGPYRSKWRTTLGQYMRGPQQDFRFLLPLIYRNEVMTTRLTESILMGKSVVR